LCGKNEGTIDVSTSADLTINTDGGEIWIAIFLAMHPQYSNAVYGVQFGRALCFWLLAPRAVLGGPEAIQTYRVRIRTLVQHPLTTIIGGLQREGHIRR